MEFYDERDFYSDDGSPVEHFVYSNYRFIEGCSDKWGEDYDMFVYVCNAVIPYIRLVKKRDNCMTPCGGSAYPSTDGSFASKTDVERDEECPKIAWGFAAYFLINLRYDNHQQDYVIDKDVDLLFSEYYNQFKEIYLQDHSGLKFHDVSLCHKELDFIEIHKEQEQRAWGKSTKLEKYNILYTYTNQFVSNYFRFIANKEIQLKSKNMPKIGYLIEKRNVQGKEYLKVFVKDNSEIKNIQSVLSALSTIERVNITESQSVEHSGNTLTIYPKPMCSCEETEKEIQECLDNYRSNVTRGDMKADSTAHFYEIESQILTELEKANATIDVCVAWFTNDKLREKILEKKKAGVKVRVITFKDGVNKAHGVDLSEIAHKELRSERGGIMHDKFCVIDNVTAITGSYNWTNNAEFHNDENIAIRQEDFKFASKYTRQFNEMWDKE